MFAILNQFIIFQLITLVISHKVVIGTVNTPTLIILQTVFYLVFYTLNTCYVFVTEQSFKFCLSLERRELFLTFYKQISNIIFIKSKFICFNSSQISILYIFSGFFYESSDILQSLLFGGIISDWKYFYLFFKRILV